LDAAQAETPEQCMCTYLTPPSENPQGQRGANNNDAAHLDGQMQALRPQQQRSTACHTFFDVHQRFVADHCKGNEFDI